MSLRDIGDVHALVLKALRLLAIAALIQILLLRAFIHLRSLLRNQIRVAQIVVAAPTS